MTNGLERKKADKEYVDSEVDVVSFHAGKIVFECVGSTSVKAKNQQQQKAENAKHMHFSL